MASEFGFQPGMASNTDHRRTRGAAAASRYPLAHISHLGPHHESMGPDSDGEDYESLATLLAVALAALSKHKTHTTRTCRGRSRQTAAVYDSSLFMHEIDGSEGEDNSPRVKRTVFPRPAYKASSACEIIWCSELVRVCR